MLKIFTTQLIGLFNGIQEREEFHLEDAARLLSQALVGEGAIYIYGHNEMKAVEAEALDGKERLSRIKPLVVDGKMVELSQADRVLLITRTSADEETNLYARKLAERNIPFVVISTMDEEGDFLVKNADVHLHLNVKTSLVPADDGTRIAYPATLVALYTYFCLYCLVKEMIMEFE